MRISDPLSFVRPWFIVLAFTLLASTLLPLVHAEESPASGFVTVRSTTRSPLRVPYTSDLTLLAAINAAGGLIEYANSLKARLIREDKVTVYDIHAIWRDSPKDVPLKPGDIIEFPPNV